MVTRTRFDDYCRSGYLKHGQKFIPPTGDAFIDAFNRGDMYRVKVMSTLDGKDFWPRWGYVSATMGWRPAFILMKRRGQIGSSDLLNPLVDKIVETKWLKERPRKRSR